MSPAHTPRAENCDRCHQSILSLRVSLFHSAAYWLKAETTISAIVLPIASDAVAAGEGALQTWITRLLT